MKKLTRKQRHQLYKKMLEIYLNTPEGECMFLCWALNFALGRKEFKHINFSLYPEFKSFAPSVNHIDFGFAWYTDYGYENYHYHEEPIKNHQRLVLLFCIEMTK